MIHLSHITKTYPDTGVCALSDLSLDVLPGEYLSVIGASGSGKTTLMQILGLLDLPDSGSYLLAGETVSRLSEGRRAALRRRRIGFVFQSFRLSPALTALDNAALTLTFRGEPLRARREKARQALIQVGLADRLSSLPDSLSGGQRQRVAIARAIAAAPDLLLADEPTGSLDPQSAEEVLSLFDRLHRQGVTILLITHDLKAANRADRVLRLADGRLFPASFLPISVK